MINISSIISESINTYLTEHEKDFVKGGIQYTYQQPAVPHSEVQNFTPKVKPIIVYKQFKMRLDKKTGKNLAPGYVFPLYVNTDGTGTNQGLQVGKWYKSGAGECWLNTKNGKLYTRGNGYGTDGQKIDLLAMRSGWHTTNTPFGNQRGANKVTGGKEGTGNNYQNTWDSEVWAKVEICVDVDATERTLERAKQAGSTKQSDQYLERIGNDEFYKFKTNSNATDDQSWYIVDKMRIVEILDDDTVDSTNQEYYDKLSKETGRKINNNPREYTSDSGDIPYWKMPRVNGKRYSKDELLAMGYTSAQATNVN